MLLGPQKVTNTLAQLVTTQGGGTSEVFYLKLKALFASLRLDDLLSSTLYIVVASLNHGRLEYLLPCTALLCR